VSNWPLAPNNKNSNKKLELAEQALAIHKELALILFKHPLSGCRILSKNLLGRSFFVF
jgi:hypothetical protein